LIPHYENEREARAKSHYQLYKSKKKEGRAAKKSPHFVIKPRNSSIDFGAQLIKISSGEFF
jgi:hypothetical protein